MADEIRVITAGSRDVYEVIKSGDGLKVTIRESQNHDHKIELLRSVLPTLIKILQGFQ